MLLLLLLAKNNKRTHNARLVRGSLPSPASATGSAPSVAVAPAISPRKIIGRICRIEGHVAHTPGNAPGPDLLPV